VGYRNFLMAAGFAAAATVAAAPAEAAPVTATKDASGKALILIPLTLTKVDDLDFGSIIPSSSSGSVTIPANGGLRSMTGGVTPVASDPGSRAVIAGAGSFGEQVNIFLAPPANLSDGNGHTLPIAMNVDSNRVTIDSTRAFSIGVGGTVTVGPNQVDGTYTGTFTVLAQYN
jgi:hypothetical protein